MKRIGLMDCNNFFVSCERLFRPDLLKKPVAVLSSNDGCIVARSQEVKDLGVSMGVPYFQIKELCTKENITLFSSNLTLYRDISARVMTALKEEFEICEIYSVDEAFFTVDDSMTEYDLMNVRARIMQKTGIPVSIGVASTKTLAKLSSKRAKQGSGVDVLTSKDWEEYSKEVPCGSVWGIGRQLTTKLAEQNIHTVQQFLDLDTGYVAQKMGVVGSRLHMELSGVPLHAVGENAMHEQKSYTSTRSFGSVTHDKNTLASSLGHHVSNLAEKLRQDGQLASRLTVIVKGSRFGTFSYREGVKSVYLETPTNDTFMLVKEAGKILDALYDSEIPYKKAGIILSEISPETMSAPSLFDSEIERGRKSKINEITDVLNLKYGRNTIRNGTISNTYKWKESKKLASKEYTTRWADIPRIKAI